MYPLVTCAVIYYYFKLKNIYTMYPLDVRREALLDPKPS